MPGFFNSILGFLSRRGIPAPTPLSDRRTPFHTTVIILPGNPSDKPNEWRFTNIFLHKN